MQLLTEKVTTYSQTCNKMPKFSIIAPWGAFGNHLRWLLLLDPAYSFNFVPTKRLYQSLAEPSWILYEDFCKLNNSVDLNLEQFENTGKFTTPDTKIEFINKNIYPYSRSWHNWLELEWIFRMSLGSMIMFGHKHDSLRANEKSIILTCDFDLALKSYLKFNSSLNNIGIDGFYNKVQAFNKQALELNSDNILVLDSAVLFQEQLDLKFYQTVVNWLGLSDMYQHANIVHQRWYALQKNAESEFVHYVNNIYK